MRWTMGRHPDRTYFPRFLIVSESSEHGGMLKLERGTRFELATACVEGTECRPSLWALFAAAAAAYSAMTMP